MLSPAAGVYASESCYAMRSKATQSSPFVTSKKRKMSCSQLIPEGDVSKNVVKQMLMTEQIKKRSNQAVSDADERRNFAAKKQEMLKERKKEFVDEPHVLEKKCAQLATAMKMAQHLIVYTGAGISTSASIPDYRGPQGVWTLLQKGESVQKCDLSDTDPTATHMALVKLYQEGIVRFLTLKALSH